MDNEAQNAETSTSIKELADFKYALDRHAIVAVTDRKGGILYANDKFCEISKYSLDELIGKNHRILNSKYHSEEFFRDLWQTIKSGNVWRGDIRNRAKDGSFYWVDTTIVPILDEDGAPDRYIAIRAVISERKRLEEENAQMIGDLKAANQELADFAYIISHDLKAPLRGISSLAGWLVDDYADKLDAAGKEKLSLMAARVARLNSLVDGILAYSRAGRNKEELILVDLNSLIRNTVDLLAVPENISIEISTPLPRIIMENYKAQQVFQNLISNAVKFMDKPIGQIKISAARDKEYWHFTVADNGPGIDSKYFDRVFELFQTLNARDVAESTGVGLSLVKKIIELYGGKVWVESEVDVKTVFHFTLPVAGSVMVNETLGGGLK